LGHKNKLKSKINELRASSSQQSNHHINTLVSIAPSTPSPHHQQILMTTVSTNTGNKWLAGAAIPLWVVSVICLVLWIVAFALLGKGLKQASDCDSDYNNNPLSPNADNNWLNCNRDAAKTLIGCYVCFGLAVIFCCIYCCVGACTGLCCLCCWGSRSSTSTTFTTSTSNQHWQPLLDK
jgi:hypothetical protein